MPDKPTFVVTKVQVLEVGKIISFMKARRLLQKGFMGLLAMVRDTIEGILSLAKIPVVDEILMCFLRICKDYLQY